MLPSTASSTIFLIKLIPLLATLLLLPASTQAAPAVENNEVLYTNSDTTSPNIKADDSEAQLSELVERSQAEQAVAGSENNNNNINTISNFKLSLIPAPAKTAESVNLEKEGIPSKVLSSYDYTQKKLADVTNVEPIIDTISEHEKYGNNGDMFDGISRTIVNGYEAFSNLLNKLIQTPKEFARSISKGITAQLDIIGGKIVGL